MTPLLNMLPALPAQLATSTTTAPTWADGLTIDGWIVMLSSVTFVTVLLVACLWTVLTSAPPDIGDEPEEVEAYRREQAERANT